MKYFWLILFCLLSFAATAQQKQGAWWMIGGNISLDFNKKEPLVEKKAFTGCYHAGAATVSDANGNLLFFSQGGYLYTRSYTIDPVTGEKIFRQMPNGYPYNGSCTYSDMIVQSPADPQVYYFFFYRAFNPLNLDTTYIYCQQVDMRLNNGLGDVVPGSKRIVQKGVATNISVLQHANNRDYWILNFNQSGDSTFTRLLSPAGLSVPVKSFVSPIIPNATDPRFAWRLKSSPNSQLFAATDSSKISLFDFDRATGQPVLRYSLHIPSFASIQAPFSVAFSPDNAKLYVGTKFIGFGHIRQLSIFQYNLSAGNSAVVQQSCTLIDSMTSIGMSSNIADMQLGIDGKLYVLIDGDMALSRINCPNQVGTACRFRHKEFNFPTSTFGVVNALPSLNQTIFRNANKLQAQAKQDSICPGDSVQLSAFGAGAEHFQWKPANGLSAPSDTLSSPFVKPTFTTTYMVTGSSLCRTDTAFVKVTVIQNPTGITISGPVSVCPQLQNVVYKAINPQKHKIAWGVQGGSFTRSSPDSITVNWGSANATAKVWLLAQNSLGCPGDTVFLPVSVNVILATQTPKGPDTLCIANATNISYQIVKTTGSAYTWGISGGTILNGQGSNSIKVNWQQTGTGKLWVQEESQTSTSHCYGNSDTLRVFIQPSPITKPEIKGPVQVFTFAESQEYFVQNPAAGSSFTWEITNGQLSKGQGSSSISVNWENAGTGTVGVTEKNLQGCEGSKSTLMVQISGAPQPLFYNIITPNADGKNDSFEIGNLKWYPENELQIYNRWGMEVYRTDNYRNTWQAGNVSAGIYYYLFKANGRTWKGWVDVIK
jgi:gliding motility-associated-like protein